jgi:hypothetical protein
MVYFEIVPITQKAVVDVCYKLNDLSLIKHMLLELMKGLKNLGVLEKHLERTCKGLDIKINYNKT